MLYILEETKTDNEMSVKLCVRATTRATSHSLVRLDLLDFVFMKLSRNLDLGPICGAI